MRKHNETKRHGSWHHRKCKSNGGKNTTRNMVYVKRNMHQSYHALFGNAEPKDIARMLTDTWIDPDWYLAAFPRKRQPPREMETCPCCGKRSAVKTVPLLKLPERR